MLSKPMRGARPNRQHWSAKGLVGEWLFNEGCGTKAFDSSGNGNHGVLTNMASPPTASSGWNPSKNGGGLTFDGGTDFVNCGNNHSLNISDALTIVICAKCTKTGAYQGLMTKHYLVGTWKGYLLGRANTNKWMFTIGGPAGQTHLYSNASCTDTNFHHIVGLRKNSVNYMFVDGVEQTATNAAVIADSATLDLQIGQYYPDYGGLKFNGSIDSVKIYNRGLSVEEVAWDYINEYAKYQPRLTLAQLRFFAKLGVITDPSIESLSVNRTMKLKTIDRSIKSFTPERTFNLGV